MFFFLKGAVLGFLIAAPLGPIGLLCIQRTLAQGMAAGFASGLGTVFADTLYCALAAFGVTVVAGFLQDNQFYLKLAGGIALVYLGYHAFRSQCVAKVPEAIKDSMFGAFISAFFLTLANPLLLFSFAALFAGIGLGATGTDYQSAFLFVSGVFIGSSLAWLALSGTVSRMRTNFNAKGLQAINKLSGIIIIGLGVLYLIDNFTK